MAIATTRRALDLNVMHSDLTVKPLGRVTGVIPQACPKCGGELAQAFGIRIDDGGRRIPFVDETSARCRDCLTMFKVKD